MSEEKKKEEIDIEAIYEAWKFKREMDLVENKYEREKMAREDVAADREYRINRLQE